MSVRQRITRSIPVPDGGHAACAHAQLHRRTTQERTPMIRLPTSRAMGRAARVAAVLLATVMTGAGCSELGEGALLTPQHSATASADLNRIAVYAEGPPSLTIAWAMAWIGPEGGSLRILDFEVIV